MSSAGPASRRAWAAVVCVAAFVLLGIVLAAPASAAEGESPTGPIYLPAVGVGLDPLAPGKREDVEIKSQPNTSQLPYFSSSFGWFGSGFARPSPGSQTIRRVALATGDGLVFVAAGGPNRVQIFRADDLTSVTSFGPGGAASPSGAWQSLQGITYNRGELYVLGKLSGEQRVRVYDASGALLRVLAPLPRQVGDLALFEGIDAAWGELWIASAPTEDGSADAAGQQVVVLDADSGAIKGVARQPVSGAAVSSSSRGWWDVSIAPELGGAIVDRRMFRRGDLLPGLPTTDSPLCTPLVLYNCTGTHQVGTDAPWGMRWFLELPSYAPEGTSRPVQEYSIDRALPLLDTEPVEEAAEELLHQSLLLEPPGHYLTPRRSWITQQQLAGDTPTLSDIAYNAREARIDWRGYLKGSAWLRGTQKCLEYVVSQADIFVVGDRGERWYELVDGFESIELRVDGQLRAQSTSAAGQLCDPDIRQLTNGTHSLELEAKISDGRTLTVENHALRIDNAAPSATLQGPGPYAVGTVNVAGLITDAHSGVRDWALEVQPSGGSWRSLCSGQADELPGGAVNCAWDTTREADGAYNVRLRGRDGSSDLASLDPTPQPDDDGNVGYSAVRTTIVDNTPPTLTATGALRDSVPPEIILEAERPGLAIDAQDSPGSGLKSIEVLIDGVRSDYAEQPCSGGGCAMSHGYTLNPLAHAVGEHTVRIAVADHAGHTATVSWRVFVNRQGPQAADPDESSSYGSPEEDTDFTDPNESPDDTEPRGHPSNTQAATAFGPGGLSCAEGDRNIVDVVVDYAASVVPSELPAIGALPSLSPSPDAVVTDLLAVGGLPVGAAGAFTQEFSDPPFRVMSAFEEGHRRAVVLLVDTPRGLVGTAVSGCSQFFASHDPLGGLGL